MRTSPQAAATNGIGDPLIPFAQQAVCVGMSVECQEFRMTHWLMLPWRYNKQQAAWDDTEPMRFDTVQL
jgi:hypothetical protein